MALLPVVSVSPLSPPDAEEVDDDEDGWSNSWAVADGTASTEEQSAMMAIDRICTGVMAKISCGRDTSSIVEPDDRRFDGRYLCSAVCPASNFLVTSRALLRRLDDGWIGRRTARYAPLGGGRSGYPRSTEPGRVD
jgi:hypothetical protein